MQPTILRPAQAGSLESSDCLVTVSPGEPGSGVKVNIQSIVMNQFGDEIRATVEKAVAETNVTDILIDVNDRGAVDFVLRARVLTAIDRALGKEEGR